MLRPTFDKLLQIHHFDRATTIKGQKATTTTATKKQSRAGVKSMQAARQLETKIDGFATCRSNRPKLTEITEKLALIDADCYKENGK